MFKNLPSKAAKGDLGSGCSQCFQMRSPALLLDSWIAGGTKPQKEVAKFIVVLKPSKIGG